MRMHINVYTGKKIDNLTGRDLTKHVPAGQACFNADIVTLF
jgi:hypothetical protein